MYKLIIATLLLFSGIIYFPKHSTAATSDLTVNSPAFEKLLDAVQIYEGNNTIQPDLSDYTTKAQTGLNSMYPGSRILNLQCEKLIYISSSTSELLRSYFEELYKNDIDKTVDLWIDNIISEFIGRQVQIGIMKWEIAVNGYDVIRQVRSISVFDENGNVLYDTELANFTKHTELESIKEKDNNSQTGVEAISNQASQTRSRSIEVSNAFGSVILSFQARITAIVSPYITASTNDAEYNYFTEYINCTRGTTTGIPPNATPFLYFGTGGSYAILYSNATPSTSPIALTGGAGDRFNNGLYSISIANGMNWSFTFDFSVDFPGGSIGITPHSNISALSLSANSNTSVNMLNYVYNENVATGNVKAVFYNGGSLDAENFKIMTGSGAGETGKINLTSKLRAGYIGPNFSINFFSETSAGFDFAVQFLRGDHVLQPSYQLTSTRYNIQIGQIDTLKAKIKNNSRAVKLVGGNVSIDVSSLDNKLTVLSSASLPVNSIDTSATKEFKFVIRGNSNGIITPQVNISALGWESPVPPSILINTIASIDSVIDVSPLIKSLTLTMPIQGFYNASTNSMTRDTVRIYLRNATAPYSIVDSAKAYLNTSGTAIFNFSEAVNFTQYYIMAKHRNSIETWSRTPQIFINSELSYDFSTSETQAYGDNLIQVDISPVRFAAFSGDVNQDGTSDATDLSMIDNSASNFASGYVTTDLDGNNFVDAADAAIADNNAANFVTMVRP